MNEYYRYLSDGLGEAIEHFDTPSEAAHHICITLAIYGGEIPETFFRMYTEYLDIDQSLLRNAAAFFSGMGKLSITCDCYEDHYLCDIMRMSEGPFYEMGKAARLGQDATYCEVNEHIAAILVDMKE